MKRLIVLLAAFLLYLTGICQNTFADTASTWFDELKVATRQNTWLWKYDLYAPVLLVNPVNRQVFANFPDSTGQLEQVGDLYIGYLPQEVNISNTSLEWSGVYWAMVMLPMSTTKNSRIHLLSHELFHRAQKNLGFYPSNPDNSHLDKKEGRIFLRLELEALKKAVLAPTRAELLKHIENALYFRSERHAAYVGSKSTENLLELNEGLSEFTGFMLSGREGYEARKYFSNRMTRFASGGSYIRSFAYETIPVYGFLLNPTRKGWNREIRQHTDLTEFFITAFAINLPDRRKNSTMSIGKEYGYAQILIEETNREEESIRRLANYRKLFLDTVHVEIPLINMNMSFDYTQQFSLDTLGMVYPSIRITDTWGILEAEEGVLIRPGWKQINISYPLSINDRKIVGQGWTLDLNEGFVIEKDEATGNYHIRASAGENIIKD